MKLHLLIFFLSSVLFANAQIPDSLQGKRLIQGVLFHKITREVLTDVRVVLTVGDKYGTTEYSTTSNDSGQYTIYIDTSYVNEIHFFKERFTIEKFRFEKGFKDTTRYFDRYGYQGQNCGPTSIVHFDKKSGLITESSYDDIERVEKTLMGNPNIIMEIRAHTDCRGSFKENKRLSRKWVNQVVDILVLHGIDRKRLKVKAMGELELLNKCKDGVECYDEEHAINNRVDFKIVGFR